MSKLEVLELLKDILDCTAETNEYGRVTGYPNIVEHIERRISEEKSRPGYFDCTLEEHQEALYG